MSLTIRHLTNDDYDAIIALWQAAGLPIHIHGRDSRAAFAQQMQTGHQTILGLEKDGVLIGVVLTTHDGRKGWINRLAVHPDHRRQGHAQRLITEAEHILREGQGMTVIAVLIEDWNEASMALFQKTGYATFDGGVHYLSKRTNADA